MVFICVLIPSQVFRSGGRSESVSPTTNKESRGLSQTAVDLVQQGKGTPQDTVALANALLRVRGEESSPADVRSRVLFDHNIGLDCSGRTSQSYLDALE